MLPNVVNSAEARLEVADPDGSIGPLELHHHTLSRAVTPVGWDRLGQRAGGR